MARYDLSDEAWALIQPLLPTEPVTPRPKTLPGAVDGHDRYLPQPGIVYLPWYR